MTRRARCAVAQGTFDGQPDVAEPAAATPAGTNRAAQAIVDRQFWDLSIDLLAVANVDGYLTLVNPSWQRVLGHSPEELMACPYLEFVHPDDLERTLAEAEALKDPTHLTLSFENRYRTSDGRYRWLAWNVRPSAEGGALVCVGRDVTDTRTAHELLQASDERLRDAQRLAGIGSWEYRIAEQSLAVSEGFREICGLPDAPVVVPLDLQAVLAQVHAKDRAAVRAAITAIVEGRESEDIDYRFARRDGTELWIQSRVEQVHEDDVPIGARGTIQDITQHKGLEHKLHESQEMFHRGFDDAPVGMGLIDPLRQGFIYVNDAMCGGTGLSRPELEATGALGRLVSAEQAAEDDETLAQLAGGEIATHEAERRLLREDVTDCWVLRTMSAITAADGAVTAIFCQIIDITERKLRELDLLRQVDEATWVTRIRDALDQGRFVLFAQPIIDLTDGSVAKHELLIRMRGDDDELVPPGAFLPTAERYGLIREIDHWVVRSGIQFAREGMPVTINISASSMSDPAMFDVIEEALRTTGADPGDVTFEITETALLEALDRGELFARRIVALGCNFALDDFGTGYGSFTYLKRLPADYLKIDMEFVRDLATSDPDRHVVAAVVALARGFGQRTIAEGVEHQLTLELLRELGVDFAQGYHIGRPTPAIKGVIA